MCYIYRSLGPSVENRSPTRPIFFPRGDDTTGSDKQAERGNAGCVDR